MIIQEQSVLCKKGLVRTIEGTLILTSERLIFACDEEKLETESNEPRSEKIQGDRGIVVFSDIASLAAILQNPSNLFVPISSMESVSGHRGITGMPNLKVSWVENGERKSAEFEQMLTGRSRKMNLNNWADLIEKLMSKSVDITSIPSPPPLDTTVGKVAYVMWDMQSKGILEIEQRTEEQFKVELDPDQVEAACQTLIAQGFLEKETDPSGDAFYRKRSPSELMRPVNQKE